MVRICIPSFRASARASAPPPVGAVTSPLFLSESRLLLSHCPAGISNFEGYVSESPAPLSIWGPSYKTLCLRRSDFLPYIPPTFLSCASVRFFFFDPLRRCFPPNPWRFLPPPNSFFFLVLGRPQDSVVFRISCIIAPRRGPPPLSSFAMQRLPVLNACPPFGQELVFRPPPFGFCLPFPWAPRFLQTVLELFSSLPDHERCRFVSFSLDVVPWMFFSSQPSPDQISH